MKNIVAPALVAFALALSCSQAGAAEGRTADAVENPAKDRVSSYGIAPAASSVDGAAATAAQPSAKQKTAAVHRGKSASKTLRGSVRQSGRFSDFYIYDVTTTLRLDRDGDGYHSEFRVRFDADVLYGDAYVYARLYLRRAGESEWFLYHETDDFYISGQTPIDEYYVTTRLDDGYPTGEYDVLIDLYESGYSGIVATIDPYDSGALGYLPLEETGLDVPADIPGYSIRDVVTELMSDVDGDGHYSRFRITFDPDADLDPRLVYARIWLRPRGGDWIEEFASEDFWVDTVGQADAYELSVAWQSGYPTSFYDVQIDLYDSASDLLLASAGSERAALSQLPLEDQGRDRFVNSPAPGAGGDTSSREGGGGSFELWSLLALLGLGAARRMARRRDEHVAAK